MKEEGVKEEGWREVREEVGERGLERERKGGREEVMEREENTEMRKHAVGAKVVQMRNQTLG